MRNKFSRRCERPFFMLEANLFKVFTSRLNEAGITYMHLAMKIYLVC